MAFAAGGDPSALSPGTPPLPAHVYLQPLVVPQVPAVFANGLAEIMRAPPASVEESVTGSARKSWAANSGIEQTIASDEDLSAEDKVFHEKIDLAEASKDAMMQKFEARYGALDKRQKRLVRTASTTGVLSVFALTMVNGFAQAAASAPLAVGGTLATAGVVAGSVATVTVANVQAAQEEPVPIARAGLGGREGEAIARQHENAHLAAEQGEQRGGVLAGRAPQHPPRAQQRPRHRAQPAATPEIS